MINDKKSNIVKISVLSVLSTVLLPQFSYGTSWVWVSDLTPYKIFPIIAIITVLIEMEILINFTEAKHNRKKTFLSVLAGNMLSFIIAYLPICGYVDTADYVLDAVGQVSATAINVDLLVGAVLFKIPVVYISMKNSEGNNKKILLTLAVSVAITLLLTFIAEYYFCKGMWAA